MFPLFVHCTQTYFQWSAADSLERDCYRYCNSISVSDEIHCPLPGYNGVEAMANGMELLPRGRYFFHVAFIRPEYGRQMILFGGRRFGGKRYQYHLHTTLTMVPLTTLPSLNPQSRLSIISSPAHAHAGPSPID